MYKYHKDMLDNREDFELGIKIALTIRSEHRRSFHLAPHYFHLYGSRKKRGGIKTIIPSKFLHEIMGWDMTIKVERGKT
jgi:hypothetical protein